MISFEWLYVIPGAVLVFFFIFLFQAKGTEVSTLYANYYSTNEFERYIHQILLQNFPANQVFLNYMFGQGNKTSQIDHLVITNKGIFIIESKDYKGMIKGKGNEIYWTQILEYVKSTPSKYVSYSYSGRPYRKHYLQKKKETHTFYNPLLQNHQHRKVFMNFFQDVPIPVVSLIVFSDRGDLSIQYDTHDHTYLIQASKLNSWIKYFLQKSTTAIDDSQLGLLESLLVCLNTNSNKNIDEHIQRLSTFNK